MDAVKLQLCTTLILGAVLFLCFGIFNNCQIPVGLFTTASGGFGAYLSGSSVASITKRMDGPADSTLAYKLDFFNFIPVALGFLGWLLFVMFAGIGLIALPFDLIIDFFYQPNYVYSGLTG